mmetsp:Transcript_11880/g.19062  ORF Transcript_11880/g.19062 Transcript_11880/m.19062 type:complete len:198 (+) Transcript_11880:638-1231(+)
MWTLLTSLVDMSSKVSRIVAALRVGIFRRIFGAASLSHHSFVYTIILVEDNEIIIPGSGRRIPALQQFQLRHTKNFVAAGTNNDTNGGQSDGSSSIRTIKATGSSAMIENVKNISLMDDSDEHVKDDDVDVGASTADGTTTAAPAEQRPTGDLDDELGFIQAQLNSARAPGQGPQSLSNTTSFDSGKFDWSVACKKL